MNTLPLLSAWSKIYTSFFFILFCFPFMSPVQGILPYFALAPLLAPSFPHNKISLSLLSEQG